MKQQQKTLRDFELHKQKRMDRLMNSKTYEITFMFKLQKQFSVYLTTIIFPSKNLVASNKAAC